jgi:segregation and condensation protein B
MKLSSKIEAILFYKAEPVSVKEMAKLLNTETSEIEQASQDLKEELSERGISLLLKDGEMILGTDPELSPLIDQLVKEELSRDLGKAGLETLSIILYKGPVSRSEVDYIRGVNSTFIIRNLLIRGLIDKSPNPKDSRSFVYSPTFQLLSFLGIESVDDLPDKEMVLSKIESFKKEHEAEEDEKMEQESKSQQE